MSSNPTQPKLGDQGEGVNFPPEDDAEGHRYVTNAEGDGGTDGFAARLGEGDGQPEGFRAVSVSEDDTEGHRIAATSEAGGQPDDYRLVMADGDEDDTEGHRIAFTADDEKDGPDDLRSL